MKVKLIILDKNAMRIFTKETELPEGIVQVNAGITFWMDFPCGRIAFGVDSISWEEKTGETHLYLDGESLSFLVKNPSILLSSEWEEEEITCQP